MTWFRVDDSFPQHPKVLRIPRRDRATAVGLWTLAGGWCASQLTDGRLAAHMLDELASSQRYADALVNVNLWETTEDGYAFHDWADWQPTRAEVEAKRDADARRKQEWRDKKKAKRDAGVTTDATCDESVRPASVTPSVRAESALSRPDPTRPDPVPKGTSETTGPRKRVTPTPDIFPITDSMRSWAVENGVTGDLDDETRNFLDHHRAKGSTFKDWAAAWRTWMRNSRRFTTSTAAREQPGYKPSEAWMHQYGDR